MRPVTYSWLVVVVAVACAAIGWLGIAGWLALVVAAASVGMHVAGNAIGTRLRAATDSDLRRHRSRIERPALPSASPSLLERRSDMGRLVRISAGIGAACGGVAGTAALAWLLVAWVVAGVLTVLAALSYGELAGMMPKAGGQFVYLQRAYGRLTAFLYGWTAFTVITSGIIAAVAVAFAKFSAVFFPVLSPDNILLDLGFVKVSSAQVYAVATILLLTWFNTRGVESSKTLNSIFTTAKIIAVLALVVVGLAVGLGTDVLATNFSTGWEAATRGADGVMTPLTGAALLSALGVAMVGSLFSSDGWNSITFIAGEVKQPQHNIPRSLLLGTFLVTALYVLANITYLSLLPGEAIMNAEADRVGTAAAQVIMGPAAVSVMAILIMVSTFGCINGYVLVGPRMYYAMAKEGLFLKKAGHLSSRGVPQWALWGISLAGFNFLISTIGGAAIVALSAYRK